MIQNRNIIFVAAHFDDLELGCGGTISKLNKNNNIKVVIICNSEFYDVNNKLLRDKKIAKKEGTTALNKLGIKNKQVYFYNFNTFEIQKKEYEISHHLIKLNIKNNFDIIFTHWENDVHPDHKNLNSICNSVFKNTRTFIEFSSNFYHENFVPNFFINISEQYHNKINSIDSHESEMKRTKNIWKTYFIQQCKNDGIRFKEEYVERFRAKRIFMV
jgi:LmbE family N-acetylglucosaminyl deacetylase